MKRFILVFFLVFSYFSAQAEYRVFMLKITAPNGKDFRLVKSTLDHIQYPIYHPIDPKESIHYIETWMCKGNTNQHKPLCKGPSELKQEAALNPPQP